jgi:hypothetical protein
MAEDNNKNGRFSITNVLTILGMGAGLLGVWGTLSADNARTKERVDQLEKRVDVERQDTKADVKEIKSDVRATNEAVQLILRKLDVMEAGAMRGRRDNQDARGGR